jgi:predicted TIM-barrel fold metal-dependent hydrolase
LKSTGSARGIVSISTPGAPIAGTGQAARDLCRELNLYLGNLTAQNPNLLDFFATLPDWRDVNGTLAEIDWIYTEQKSSVGVILYTGYGDNLPGDSLFQPIWDKLESYKALTFLHPGTMDVKPFLINGNFPQPFVDYPQQTTRAAVDLVISGTRTRTPNVDMILAHAGGTLPYISQRILGAVQFEGYSNVSATEAASQFSRFYYDFALSATATQLNALLAQTSPNHILLGSDYPYTPAAGVVANQAEYLSWAATHPQLSPTVLSANAQSEIGSHKLL